MTGLVPECFECAHMLGVSAEAGWVCAAFPGGIPIDILSRQRDHRSPRSGDRGIVFAPAAPEDQLRAASEYIDESLPPNYDALRASFSGAAVASAGAESVARSDSFGEIDLPRGAPAPPPLRAAGVMHVTDDGRVLFCRRSDTGEWAFPGGKIEPGETADEAAARECEEEIGRAPGELQLWTRRIAGGVDFSTFLARVAEPFAPILNDEHTDYAWEYLGDHSAGALDYLMGLSGQLDGDEWAEWGQAGEDDPRADAQFNESDHPRDKDGKFTAGAAQAKAPAKVAVKAIASNSVWKPLMNAGFLQNKYSKEAVLKNPKTGVTVYFTPPLPGKKVTSNWHAVSKNGTVKTGYSWNELDWTLNKFAGEGDQSAAPQPAAQPQPAGPDLKLAAMIKIGAQMGSNPGGTYETPDGKKLYVKTPKTNDHVKNEILAGNLYNYASGGGALKYHEVDAGDGKLAVATEIVPLSANKVNQLSSVNRERAQADFAIQAWLGNWDAVGVDGSNIGVNGETGKVIPLDLGGALLYRAQGAAKGSSFNDAAAEWNTLRDPNKNPMAASLYKDMSQAQLQASAKKLEKMNDELIAGLVNKFGPGGAAAKAALTSTLIKRRDAILARAKVDEKPKVQFQNEGKHGLSAADKTEARELRKLVAKAMPSRSHAVQGAIESYKGSGYTSMNECMRYLDDCDQERVTHLEKYLDEATLPAMTVYRGVRADYAKKILAHASVGKRIVDNGFASTATSEEFSRDWAGHDGLLFEIKVPEGARGAAVRGANQEDGEYEILLQRNLRFTVEAVDLAKRKMTVSLDYNYRAGLKKMREAEEAA